jgi:protein SCO1/2
MSPRRLATSVALARPTLCALGLVASLGLPAARGDQSGSGVESGHHGHEAAHAHHEHHAQHPRAPAAVTRSVAWYVVPDVTLSDQTGQAVALRKLLDADRPVLVNFVFTTCTAICPVMSATFAAVQRELGADVARVRMVSISIDPEHDTPAVLGEYAGRFGAGPQWHFLTGALADTIAVLRAFDAYRGEKMSHEPLTLLRAGPGTSWVRYDGFASAATLLEETRAMLAGGEGGTLLARELPDGGGGAAAPGPAEAPVPTASSEGRAFLEENARRPGVVVLPSGLQYRVLEAGSGRQPGSTDAVTVHYRATTTAGTEFDSTYAQGGPMTRRVDQFAPGWAEGLQLMREGARWELFIPPALGFGERSVLRDRVVVVTMDLLSVAPAPARAEPAGQGPTPP